MLGQEFHDISPLVVGSQQFATALPTPPTWFCCKSYSFSSVVTAFRTEDADVQRLFLAFISVVVQCRSVAVMTILKLLS